MEGTLEKWLGYFSGWKAVKFTLQDGILKEEGEKDIRVDQCIVNPLHQKDTEFEVDEMGNVLYLRAKDRAEKEKWIDALVECEGNYYEEEKEVQDDEDCDGEGIQKVRNGNEDSFKKISNCQKSDEECEVGDEDEDEIDTKKIIPTAKKTNKASVNQRFNAKDLNEDMEIRTELPAFKDPNRTFSLWEVLKNIITLDLTRVTMPIYLNEPVCVLQKCCETMEYYQVLESACKETDPCMRMAYVSIFMTILYSSADDRTCKPFNPLLGETYEYVCKDFKYFAEQVSHHPPISAYHVYGKGYQMWTSSQYDIKFKGTYLQFTPNGKAKYLIGDEEYSTSRPQFLICNIIFGKTYIDLRGSSTTTCPQTGVRCELNHFERGSNEDEYNKVEGYVYNQDDEEVLQITGFWNDSIKVINLETEEETVIWQRGPKAENYIDQYGLTPFAINLNNLPERLKGLIAPTDSRFRPDLRAFENGDIDLGADEKQRLEEKQRAKRKDMEFRFDLYPVFLFDNA